MELVFVSEFELFGLSVFIGELGLSFCRFKAPFGLGIFLLNLAVSYFYSSKPIQLESGIPYSIDNSLPKLDLKTIRKEGVSENQDNDSNHNSFNSIPINVDVKQYKVCNIKKHSKTINIV